MMASFTIRLEDVAGGRIQLTATPSATFILGGSVASLTPTEVFGKRALALIQQLAKEFRGPILEFVDVDSDLDEVFTAVPERVLRFTRPMVALAQPVARDAVLPIAEIIGVLQLLKEFFKNCFQQFVTPEQQARKLMTAIKEDRNQAYRHVRRATRRDGVPLSKRDAVAGMTLARLERATLVELTAAFASR